MTKQHWLQAYETNSGKSPKEDLMWVVYTYGNWTVEIAGSLKADAWDEAEAVYTQNDDKGFIQHHHDIRLNKTVPIEVLLNKVESLTGVKRPEDPGCYHSGPTVKSKVRRLPVPTSIKKAVLGRLMLGEIKYGTELTVGWNKALSYLIEEEDDMVAYCVAANKLVYATFLSWVIWIRRALHVGKKA